MSHPTVVSRARRSIPTLSETAGCRRQTRAYPLDLYKDLLPIQAPCHQGPERQVADGERQRRVLLLRQRREPVLIDPRLYRDRLSAVRELDDGSQFGDECRERVS